MYDGYLLLHAQILILLNIIEHESCSSDSNFCWLMLHRHIVGNNGAPFDSHRTHNPTQQLMFAPFAPTCLSQFPSRNLYKPPHPSPVQLFFPLSSLSSSFAGVVSLAISLRSNVVSVLSMFNHLDSFARKILVLPIFC